MNWNPEEVASAADIADRIAGYAVGRSVSPPENPQLCLSLADAVELADGLHWPPSGVLPMGTLTVRHVCRLLGFDEHLQFRWRLEHKLIQALVLNHFCPGVMPPTRGLYRHFAKDIGRTTSEAIREQLSAYQVKRTVGYGAPQDSTTDAAEAASAMLSRPDGTPPSLLDEEWIIQEKVPIVEEFRVHTLEDSVVEDLTSSRHSWRIVRSQRRGPNDFVRSIMERLPNACVANSLCGWDVAETGNGDFRVIEANLGGFYPNYRQGYQASGAFQHRGGPVVIARLMRFLESKYGVQIRFDCSGPDPLRLRAWYSLVEEWTELLRVSDRIRRLFAAGETRQPIDDATESLLRIEHAHGTLMQVVKRLSDTVALVD